MIMNDLLPFASLLASPISTLRRAGLLALLGILLGIFIPGTFQYFFGTFFSEDVVHMVPKEVQQKLAEFDAITSKLGFALTAFDVQIARAASSDAPRTLTEQLDARRSLATYIESRTPPFHVE
jgi:hypothetical protein